MKRVATCIIALLSSYNGALAADEAVFVAKGNARSVREIGNRWTCKEGSLVCGGTGNFLVAGKAVGAGDFQVRARLSLERLDGRAASLVIGGNHFGFDGRGKKFFVEGPAFGRTRLLGDAGKVIAPGKPFDVEAARNELWCSVSKDKGRTWSEPRFVFAGATPGGHIHSCSYIDMFADGSRIHIFLGQDGRQLLYLHFDEFDLPRFLTKAELAAAGG